MKTIRLFVSALLVCTGSVFAQPTRPTLTLGVDVEDGKKMIHSQVSLNGKPMENVTLQYFVERTFQNLKIGEDTTLDDGTSAVAFPSDLPGGPDGTLHVSIRISKPVELSTVTASASFPADLINQKGDEEYPRALWAPNAPWSLMLCIIVLLTGVWSSYLFVVSRILAIRSGGKL